MYTTKIIAKCSNIEKSAKRFDELWTPLSYAYDEEREVLQDIIDDMRQQVEQLMKALDKLESNSI